jgi:hypothetical protein
MLNDRELATVLAALRYWQARTDITHRALDDIATCGDAPWSLSQGPLADDEIDELCERLNCGSDHRFYIATIADEDGLHWSDVLHGDNSPRVALRSAANAAEINHGSTQGLRVYGPFDYDPTTPAASF